MNSSPQTQVADEVASALLHDLVATPSHSTEEADATNLLVNWMRDQNYDDAFVDAAGNAVGIVGSGDGTQDIILLGHIDTFPGTPRVYIEGDTLYGRGSVDAKGPLCTFAAAGANLVGGLPPGVRLIVIGAVEEEAPTSAGAHFAVNEYTPRACIIGEPSAWDRVTLAYKGRLLLRWRWEGPLAHSAGETPTAAERAFAYWQTVRAYTAAFNGDTTSIFGRLDCSIRDINTGSSHNGTHQWAEMTVGFRLPPNITPDEIIAALTLPEDDPATVEPFGREYTFVAPKNSSVARVMRGAIRSEGGTPRFVYKTGTSDMNIVGPRWDCPIVAYGPGDAALDHTPNEHIQLPEYHRAIRVLTSALNRLSQEL